MCGASGEQKAAFAQQAALQKQTMDEMATIFGENQAMIASIRGAMEPIIAKGPDQQGYSPELLTALATGAADTTALGAQQAQVAAGAKAGAAGGGAAFIPSGANQQISAMLNESAAEENAREQLGIKTDSASIGRQNFFNATSAVGSVVPGLQNAGSTAGNTAVNAGSAAMEGANQIAAANNAWMGPVFGMIGSIGGAYLGKKK